MISEAQSATPPPIFILSCERAGSTLLRYIFDTHPRVCSPAQLYLGELCRSLYRSIYYSLGQTVSVESEAERDSLVMGETRRIITEFMGRYASAKGKEVWCEKTTDNLKHVGLLDEVFPDAKFVCLYRNCMDVTHSNLEGSRFGFMPELTSYIQQNPENTVAAMVNSWIEKTNRLLQFERTHPSKCFRIKYESIVLEPSQTLQSLFLALGLEWSESLLNSVFSTPHDEGAGDPKILFTKSIKTASLGLGSRISRAKIPPERLTKMNELLIQLEYPIVGPDWDSSPSPYLAAAAVATDPKDEVLTIEEVFGSFVPALINSSGSRAREIDGQCKFLIGEDREPRVIDLREPTGLARDPSGKVDCTVMVSAADLLDLVNGRQNAADAVEQGKIHVVGDYELANRIGRFLFGG
jgi:protein-tyrosine sulfotransferase